MKEELQTHRQFLGFIKTPLLWEDENFFDFPVFDFSSEIIPNSVQNFSIPENLPLGKRAEYFFKYYLNFLAEEELLLHNLQVTRDKITIGELDFLLRNKKTGTVTHVELVYKFYIYDPFFKTEKERYIGPNRKDSLLLKLNKLKNKQFPLLFEPEIRHLLQKFDIAPEVIQQKVCFKALVFLPKHFLNLKIAHINPACIAGYWIHFEEFAGKEYENSTFLAPIKQDWSIAPHFGQDWRSFSEIKEEVLLLFQKEKSPLVWMKKPSGAYERFFVVWW